MTIGLGFLCSDGVVLGADRQITLAGAYKYQEGKVMWSQSPEFTFTFSYAGSPESAQVMFRRIKEGLREQFKQMEKGFPHEKARKILEGVFYDHPAEELQTLIGFYAEHQQPFLFKTQGTKVVDGDAEYIGCGDSSALRYLSSFLVQRDNTMAEARVLTAYLVIVANKYVDGCSGGPDIVSLDSNGTVAHEFINELSEVRANFVKYERQIGEALRQLLLSGA